MFFFAVMGISQKRDYVGSVGFNCPHCNSLQNMSVFKSYSYFHIFFIPILKFSTKYDGFCDKCNNLYYIDNEIGRLIDKGIIDIIDSSSYIENKPFDDKIHFCPFCHNRIQNEDNYCRKCGYKL